MFVYCEDRTRYYSLFFVKGVQKIENSHVRSYQIKYGNQKLPILVQLMKKWQALNTETAKLVITLNVGVEVTISFRQDLEVSAKSAMSYKIALNLAMSP